ncbi:hypothetical protein PoB_007147100 [Plakobranchus ocellatus]|uniref:Uncharacterized protein n=1 Tax=Plakobranchus ocellatus TaxID=259542 RepID=A0AAV4DLX5_9GAST|nr:hypothetical protein PoB_007147100 [Plakobranchus ocellatus]
MILCVPMSSVDEADHHAFLKISQCRLSAPTEAVDEAKECLKMKEAGGRSGKTEGLLERQVTLGKTRQRGQHCTECEIHDL